MSSSRLPPMRFSAVFTDMMATCPGQVSAVRVVREAQVEGGDLIKGACTEEFAALKQCFTSSLRRLRAARR
jgi:hypothetical protein